MSKKLLFTSISVGLISFIFLITQISGANNHKMLKVACGELAQEAEFGYFFGEIEIVKDGGASGGQYVQVPNAVKHVGSLRESEDRAEYCVMIPEDGLYRVRVGVHGRDLGRNSMFVTVDQKPLAAYLWDVEVTSQFDDQWLSDRELGVLELNLTKGEHTLAFHNRESGTQIDNFEFVLVSGAGEEDACGPLEQEAENAQLVGDVVIGDAKGASQGKVVYFSNNLGKALEKYDPANRIELCMHVEVPGEYQIIGRSWAPDDGSDSFFVQVDQGPAEGYLWDVTHQDEFFEDAVNDRGKADPVLVDLDRGNHVISFYHREPNTMLDLVRLELVNPSDKPEDPIPTATQTQLPATATPTDVPPTPTSEPACGGLYQEAEDGILFGGMQVQSSGEASGGGYLFAPRSLGETIHHVEPQNRADFCVQIEEAGNYRIIGRISGETDKNDSFYVAFDGDYENSYLWDFKESSKFVNDEVNNRGVADPQIINLSAGQHTLSFIHREQMAKLDRFEFVLLGDSPTEPTPTKSGETPTATAISPTKTATALPPTVTKTPVSPTATVTKLPPTATNTPVSPTATATKRPPTATATATTVPPTATSTPVPPTATPVSTPGTACGGLEQEAELAQLKGAMTVGFSGDASGGRFVFIPSTQPDLTAIDGRNEIEFCVRVDQAGEYFIEAQVRAPDLGANSFFITVNGSPSAGYLWDLPVNGSFFTDRVSDRNGPDPQPVFLSKGDNKIIFHLRESGTVLDKIKLIDSDNAGSPVDPQPTPTSPPTVPTATPVTNPGSIDSMIDWAIDYSNVGVEGGIPNYSKTITVQGRSESDIERAINNAEPFTRIILPAGVYNVGTIDISKSNIILSGGGGSCGETILRFGSQDNGIKINGGGGTGSSVNLTSTGYRNAKSINVSNASGFNVGDYILIRQDDDNNLLRVDLSRNPNESWVKNNAAQMNRIVGKSGNTLQLEGGLNLEFKTSLDARVAKVHNMITGVGIENLTIERTVDDGASGQSGNIYFNYAANSWVKGVHSKNSVRAHIYFNNSYKNEIRGNYLEKSYNNGEGGHGYGVRLESATDFLIENNIAKLMRHSYLAQVGSNGNVFGYNFSADPYGEDHGEIFTDLSTHGGFTFSNLFEGNQAQQAKIDNIHASNVGNLFFRNRIEQDIDNFTHKDKLMPKGATTPHIWIHENQYFNSFLANEISFPGANRATQTEGHDSGRPRDNFTVCKYTNSSDGERGCGRTRETTVNHGTHDYLKGETTWDSSIGSRGFPVSAYRGSRPSFWGSSPWPMYGPDTLSLSESQKQLPAKTRFLEASQGRGSFCHR